MKRYKLLSATILLASVVTDSQASASAVPVMFVPTDFTVTQKGCAKWVGRLKLTATSLSRTDQEYLQSLGPWTAVSHKHVGADGRFTYDANWAPVGVPGSQEWVKDYHRINGFPQNPSPGATVFKEIAHNGGCAAEFGGTECVGLFFAHTTGVNPIGARDTPPTFPFGACIRVPPVGGACEILAPRMQVDYGSVGSRTSREMGVQIDLKCERPTLVTLRLTNHDHGTTDTVSSPTMSSRFRVGDVPLPAPVHVDGRTSAILSALSTFPGTGIATNTAVIVADYD